MITIIAAIDKNRVLGKDNKMPWHLPADLARFKKITTGHPVIMGRKTYDSVGKPFAERKNIVMTRVNEEIEGCIVVNSLKEAFDVARAEDDNVFVIGGAQIFDQTIPFADRLDLAFVDTEVDGDVYFPEINLEDWKEVSREEKKSDDKNEFNITWVIYEHK